MKTRILSIAIVLFILQVNNLFSQVNIQPDFKKSSITVKGTSSLHDWKMATENFNCSIAVMGKEDKYQIGDVAFSCNSTSLKSDNSIMDKKAWDALDAKKYSTIRFESNQLFEIKSKDKTTEGQLTGELELNGIKKTLLVPYKGETEQNGDVIVKGDVTLKMSDFGIVPPTAIMGTLKTGDMVTVSFTLVFDQQNQLSINR